MRPNFGSLGNTGIPDPLLVGYPEATKIGIETVHNGSGAEVTLPAGTLLYADADEKLRACVLTTVADEVVVAGNGNAQSVGKSLAEEGVIPATLTLAGTIGAAAQASAADKAGKIAGDAGGYVLPDMGHLVVESKAWDDGTNLTASYKAVQSPVGVLLEEVTLADGADASARVLLAGEINAGHVLLGATVWADLGDDEKAFLKARLHALGIFAEPVA